MLEYESFSEHETEKIGFKLSSKLFGKETVAFYGGMGMGKTTFIRGLMKGLDGDAEVSSPTFAIVNEYSGKYKVYHFDMYRISSDNELDSTGFYDYVNQGILLIEWSENVERFIPEPIIRVILKEGGKENARKILIDGVDMD